MTGFRKIPQDVYDVMNHHAQGFDKMYYRFLSETDSNQAQQDAFDKCGSRIREWFPKYKGYSSLHSYLVTRNRRNSKMLMRNKKNNV